MAGDDKENETDKGREEIEAKADKVLYPDTHRREHVFLGHAISLRPVPLLWAKQVNRAFDKARRSMTDDAKDDDLADEEAANAFINAAAALCEFYEAPFDRTQIEKRATTADVMDLCEAQAALQRENDFLLWRLREFITNREFGARALREKVKLLNDPESLNRIIAEIISVNMSNSLSSRFSPASPKPGEDSTLLSDDTQADKSG